MKKNLVIAEKPSVAKDLARVLNASKRQDGYYEGDSYWVTWALGHLVTLSDPEKYEERFKRWRIEDLPIIPKIFSREIIDDSGVKKQFNVIKNLLNHKECETVICATDAGREGELIFRLIYEESQCTKPIKRLWISSQTDKAIQEGFASLKPGEAYQNLFDSALSRSEADWLVGMNATRAYTTRFSRGNGVMSVGRVQTPVLKMIVDRHFENTAFKPETYYEIFSFIDHQKGQFWGKWFCKKEDRLTDKEQALSLFETIKKITQGHIEKVTKKETKEKQPFLYDLTELQRDANKRFKFSADQTLKLMQSLYEKHKILSYPRTSSRFLSSDLVPKLPDLIANLSELNEFKSIVKKILSQKLKVTKRIADDSKVTDHTAIIPTDKKPVLSELSPDELKVYLLVIRRFLCVFLDECIKHHTEIISQFDSHTFRTVGIVISKPGWREVYMKDSVPEEGKESETEANLPDTQKGDPVIQQDQKLEEKQTKPPPLHNEASILSAMETAGKQIEDDELREAMKDCGLGTPATRAQIIERLITVGYIVRDKNKLIPTEKGYQLISYIKDPELVSPELTGIWEKKLNDLAQGKYKREAYMKEIEEFTQKVVSNVSEGAATGGSKASVGICPLCGGGIYENQKAYGCANWKEKECKFVIWKTIAGKTISPEIAKSLIDTGKTEKLGGFISKAGKPFETTLVLKNGKVEFQF